MQSAKCIIIYIADTRIVVEVIDWDISLTLALARLELLCFEYPADFPLYISEIQSDTGFKFYFMNCLYVLKFEEQL